MEFICPECKRTITDLEFEQGRMQKIIKNIYCQNCRKNVNGIMVSKRTKTEKYDVSETEPKEKDKITANILLLIPPFGAISMAGNSKELAKFLLIRIIVFGIGFFITAKTFTYSLDNPYILVLTSSVALVIFHFGSKLNLSTRGMTDTAAAFWMSIISFPIGIILALIVTTEILLVYYNPMLFAIDVLVSLGCLMPSLPKDAF